MNNKKRSATVWDRQMLHEERLLEEWYPEEIDLADELSRVGWPGHNDMLVERLAIGVLADELVAEGAKLFLCWFGGIRNYKRYLKRYGDDKKEGLKWIK